jgi:arylsulfatase A-like enzyme
MNRSVSITVMLVGVMACAAAPAVAGPARPDKPNVVLILIDDLGWQDVKCYDIDEPSPMETPNIDALADKGVMFWQAYSPAPVCTPSRVSILSGQHPVRTGVTSVAGGSPTHFWKPQAGQAAPWNGTHFPAATVSLAEALKAEGYATGHSGKWHFLPGPEEIGFDSSVQHRGVQGGMKNRLTGFATRDPNDPFRLDENGFPYDVPQHAALDFLAANKDQPFFLYYATWLVHAPISMKSEQLLQKYVKKLGVELKPEHKDAWPMEGQTNPFYDAMVEQLDYYLGQVFTYLEATDDPRWPGHKLIENTYIIFSSDNGGMENRPPIDRFTENAPLDAGKISTKEGGIRVPLIITGPGIPAGVQTDVMANGLDFYPTILSWIGAEPPQEAVFDGCDLAPLLAGDPTDPALVRDAEGNVRDSMIWHFPQMEGTTSIRVGDYKLRRSTGAGTQPLELYRLYRTENGQQVRVDIEEENNLAEEIPEKAKELEALRAERVAAMGGRYGHWNPDWPGDLPGREKAPRILSHTQTGRDLTVSYENRGAKVVYADLVYTLNGGARTEVWRRADMTLKGDNKAVVTLPEETTHYFINLTDENDFLVFYPKIDAPKLKQDGQPYSAAAIFAGYPEPETGPPMDFQARFTQLSKPDEGVIVLLDEDFEGESPALAGGGQAGVSVTGNQAAAGARCLQLHEIEGLKQPWMPLAGHDMAVPDAVASGSFRLAFDTMLDAGAPGVLSVLVRDGKAANHFAALGGVSIGNGEARGNDKLVGEVKPGGWYHVEIDGEIGNSGNARMFEVVVTSADGGTVRHRAPYADIRFDRPTWVGLSGQGAVGSTVYIDNVVIRVEGRMNKEAQ